MRLIKVQVKNYRSIKDSGEIEIEKLKTILVGPNEAGKTVLLRAIQQLNKPDDVPGFDYLRDYPRGLLNDIQKGKTSVKDVDVVSGYFELEESDKALIPKEFHSCQYKLTRYLDNHSDKRLVNAPSYTTYSDIKKDLLRLFAHLDKQCEPEETLPSIELNKLTENWFSYSVISDDKAGSLTEFLESKYHLIDEENETEEARYQGIIDKIELNKIREGVFQTLSNRVPVFILFNNYFNVKPIIHLDHLAQRVEQNILDDEYYDYGNLCLLKLLGFTARQLADIGNTPSPGINQADALKEYRDKLDHRSYQLNAASVRLTDEIRKVWMPNPDRPEADKLKVSADGQYLKVVVEDDIGVDIELDQRSEGFQWLVSFFIVFFSEAEDKHENAILLLDEPGMSLHGLKQRDFRNTVTRLSESNQTIFTTHSPFLVGPDELDIVRVVELKNRKDGTKVHTTLSSSDPAGLLPLQEAFGYDLASSLFSQQRNLILEGLTDYWYLEAISELFKSEGFPHINDKIALVFANSAGKVVYYATILHAHKLKVAALLDSDNAGDSAAQQENLVHALGNKNILRTKDHFPNVPKAEIEDLLRHTLTSLANEIFGKDLTKQIEENPERPLIELFKSEIKDFSKYKLAKSFIRWTRENKVADLNEEEVKAFTSLINKINHVLK